MKLLLLLLSCSALHIAQAQGKATPAPVLHSIDARGLEDLRASAKGRVLVLNFWATWCKPCVEEFPFLVSIQKAYANKGVDVVFVSIDDDDARTKQKVISFLKRMKVASRSYIKKGGSDEEFINRVNPNWSGAIPATLIYDREGVLVSMRVEELEKGEMEQIVKPLL